MSEQRLGYRPSEKLAKDIVRAAPALSALGRKAFALTPGIRIPYGRRYSDALCRELERIFYGALGTLSHLLEHQGVDRVPLVDQRGFIPQDEPSRDVVRLLYGRFFLQDGPRSRNLLMRMAREFVDWVGSQGGKVSAPAGYELVLDTRGCMTLVVVPGLRRKIEHRGK